MQLYLALTNQTIVHYITKIKLNFVSLSLSLLFSHSLAILRTYNMYVCVTG